MRELLETINFNSLDELQASHKSEFESKYREKYSGIEIDFQRISCYNENLNQLNIFKK